jgi:hypothetical protein
MKFTGTFLYLFGLILFVLTSSYFVFKSTIFQNLDLENLTGLGGSLLIVSIVISTLLFLAGIICLKAFENHHGRIANIR